MSNLASIERHVDAVRRKMILQRFIRALAIVLLVVGGIAWAATLALTLMGREWPGGPWAWLAGAAGVSIAVSLFWAVRGAPSRHEAAIAIDDRLGLKEKFSTALAFADSGDAFAKLAVADANHTSTRVDLSRKFPLTWPRKYWGAFAWAGAIALTVWLVSPMEFSKQAQAEAQPEVKLDDKEIAEVNQLIQQQTNALAALPPEVAEREEFRLAKDRIAQAREAVTRDPAKARQTARESQQELAAALKNQIEKSEDYAQAKQDSKAFRNLTPPSEEQGPVADAHRAMANADFKEAIEQLEATVDNFEKLTQEEKDKAAAQMEDLAKSLQQMQNDPQQQQQMQQQMQQMGMTQQQAQQAQDLMQKAANGDQQAQQQLQNMAQQAMQQMNNGQGPTQQQQQQMQQQMQQAQQQANSQATAQQMQQMAQQMSQAMQQAAQQGQQQQGQGQGQQSSGQGQGQGQGQSQGGQAGGQPGGQGGQGMQSSSQQMQQMLSQMQAVQQNAQQMQAAQGMCEGGGQGQGQGQGQGKGGMQGQWNPDNQGGGMGGPGRGQGGQAPIAPAPFSFKEQISKSHNNEEGQIVAQTLIKADALKGESSAAIQQIVESELKDATDEVDQQRVSREVQKAVRDYFQTMAKDAGAKAPENQE